MSYWRIDGQHIVLTDDEETAVLHRAGLTDAERICYMLATPSGARLQKRVGAHLESYAASSPDEFHREYVARRGYGPEALPTLRALVDAYTRTHGRAIWGVAADLEWVDQMGAALWLGKRPDAVYITLAIPRHRWLGRVLQPTGLLGFPSAEIEKFAGTPNSFVLITSRMSVHFGPDFVRVISLPDHADGELERALTDAWS